ncbi:MAG: hypothetical protein JWN86_1754 [Planctomycetota bacterium]|nr:hypothetical protein [Planctomycetota bacterium]
MRSIYKVVKKRNSSDCKTTYQVVALLFDQAVLLVDNDVWWYEDGGIGIIDKTITSQDLRALKAVNG